MSTANIDVLQNAATTGGPSFPNGMNHAGGVASDTNKMTIPKDTTVNLALLTDVQGTIAFDTTLNSMVQNNGAGWLQIGTIPDFNIVSPTANSMTIDEEDSASLSGTGHTFYGKGSGSVVESGTNNICIGKSANPGNENRSNATIIGVDASGGTETIAIGWEAGNAAIGTTQCGNNTLIGNRAGKFTTGPHNTFIGLDAGRDTIGGTKNIAIGNLAGLAIGAGNDNVYVGYLSGASGTGTGNIFIGKDSGLSATESNRLIIENSSDLVTPLIDGVFASGNAGSLTFNISSLNLANLPTSNPGGSGNVWSNSGVLNIT